MILRILQYERIMWQSNCPVATTTELNEQLVARATEVAEDLRAQGRMEVGYFDIELVRGIDVIDHVIGCL